MNLDQLKSRLDTFIEFSRKFPAAYRPVILEHLLRVDAAERGVLVGGAGPGDARLAPQGPAAGTTAMSGATSNVDPVILDVAQEINVSPELVDRRLVTVLDGRPEIRYRSEDVSKAKRQVEYALVYIYVLEKLGQEGANLEELRQLCIQRRCYDQANFMATYKRQYSLLQLADVPGRKEQEVVLTGPGRDRARDHLRGAADRLPLASIPVAVAIPMPESKAADEDEDQLDQPDLDLGLDREEDEVEPVS